MKAVVMAGTLAVGTASIGGVAYVATHPLEQEVMQETENSETEEEYEYEEEEYECPECGEKITIDMTTCPSCGIELSFEYEDEE